MATVGHMVGVPRDDVFGLPVAYSQMLTTLSRPLHSNIIGQGMPHAGNGVKREQRKTETFSLRRPTVRSPRGAGAGTPPRVRPSTPATEGRG